MITLLTHFKIKPDCISEFVDFWKRTIIIEDKTDLMAEFLVEPDSKQNIPYITWSQLESSDGAVGPPYVSFVHVSIWRSLAGFESQVAHHFDDRAPLRPFEAERRVRTIARSRSWRIGEVPLPRHSSGGVL